MASKSDEDTDTLKHNWAADALSQQNSIARILGQSEYHTVPRHLLKEKLYSCFKMIADPGTSDKSAKALEKRILEENSSSSYFRLKPIFIHLATTDYKNYSVCLIFRVQHEQTGAPKYMDQIRTYSHWGDFLANNTLDQYYMIFPYGGNYTCETEFVMAESEACSVKSKLRKTFKFGAVSTSVISTVAIAVTPIFPVIAPATVPLIVANVIGSTVMSIDGAVKIVDLVKHDENMGLKNPTAVNAYLDVVSGFGGLSRGGATAAAKFVKEDAAMAAKIIRCAKVAGSCIQNVSLICKCLLPLGQSFSLDDFKEFCLGFLNVDVNVRELIPDVHTFINFFMMGVAIYRGNTVQTLLRLNGAKECFAFLFRSVLPEIFNTFSSEIKALGEYFSNLLCNKLSPLLPEVIDTEKFCMLKRDLFSLIDKLNVFFNVTDIAAIKFSGFPFFLTYSISGLKIVLNMMEVHLKCKESGEQHQLTRPKLVEVWFKFMDLIRCCSPQNLIRGTHFLLLKLQQTPSLPSSERELKNLANLYLDSPISSSEFNADRPLFPTLNGMQVHTFYSPVEKDEVNPHILSNKLKDLYREKAWTILRKEVSKKNSKFHKNGNGANSLLYLSPYHGWRAVVFNRTILNNGNALLFLTFLRDQDAQHFGPHS